MSTLVCQLCFAVPIERQVSLCQAVSGKLSSVLIGLFFLPKVEFLRFDPFCQLRGMHVCLCFSVSMDSGFHLRQLTQTLKIHCILAPNIRFAPTHIYVGFYMLCYLCKGIFLVFEVNFLSSTFKKI